MLLQWSVHEYCTKNAIHLVQRSASLCPPPRSHPKVRRNAFLAKSLKKFHRFLHTTHRGFVPRVLNVKHLDMMFELKLVHQTVESSIIEKLVSQRNFNAAIVHIKLDDNHIILIVVRQ